MRLHSGRNFYPQSVTLDMIDIQDIAHALSNLCRFGGHPRRFYSVAQHCVLCAGQAKTPAQALATLLHDATETYLVDVPRPIKPLLKGYQELESDLAAMIEIRFGLPIGSMEQPDIKEVDSRMLLTEATQLLGLSSPAEWGYTLDPYDIEIVPWTPDLAKDAFLEAFNRYNNHVVTE